MSTRCTRCAARASTLIVLHGGHSIFTCPAHHAAISAAHAARLAYETPVYEPEPDHAARLTAGRWGPVPGQLAIIPVDTDDPDSLTSTNNAPALFDPQYLTEGMDR